MLQALPFFAEDKNLYNDIDEKIDQKIGPGRLFICGLGDTNFHLGNVTVQGRLCLGVCEWCALNRWFYTLMGASW